MATAYLLLFLDITVFPPVPIHAGTYSEDAGSITLDHLKYAAVEVMRVGDGVRKITYAQGCAEIEQHVLTSPYCEWLRHYFKANGPVTTSAALEARYQNQERASVHFGELAAETRRELAKRTP